MLKVKSSLVLPEKKDVGEQEKKDRISCISKEVKYVRQESVPMLPSGNICQLVALQSPKPSARNPIPPSWSYNACLPTECYWWSNARGNVLSTT